MLGSLILYLKGMRIMMFQVSGFYSPKPQSLQALNHYKIQAQDPSLVSGSCDVASGRVQEEPDESDGRRSAEMPR